MSKERYEECLRTGEQYFGSHLGAKQVWDRRISPMTEFVKELSSKSTLKILEIGSWAGSSARIWAENTDPLNDVIICVDTWENNYTYAIPQAMQEAYADDAIYKLFRHNMKQYSHVIPVRADSSIVAFFDKQFDLVYVDGDHSYSICLRDLKNAIKCSAGWIAGDDLELQYKDVDQSVARTICNSIDYAVDPKTGQSYHPGVTCAVYDAFGQVECQNGFWKVAV